MPIPTRLANIVDAIRIATDNKKLEWHFINPAKMAVTAKIGDRYILVERKDHTGLAFVLSNAANLPRTVIDFSILIRDPEDKGTSKSTLKDIDSFSVAEGDIQFELMNDLYAMASLIANGVFRELDALQADLQNLNQ